MLELSHRLQADLGRHLPLALPLESSLSPKDTPLRRSGKSHLRLIPTLHPPPMKKPVQTGDAQKAGRHPAPEEVIALAPRNDRKLRTLGIAPPADMTRNRIEGVCVRGPSKNLLPKSHAAAILRAAPQMTAAAAAAQQIAPTQVRIQILIMITLGLKFLLVLN